MAKYKFKALDRNGDVIIKNNVESVDSRELILDQKSRGNEIYFIKHISEKSHMREFSPRELADFCHELSVMLSSGLTAVRVLAIMASQISLRNRRMGVVCADLSDLLKKGYTISEACRKQGGAFPDLLINALYSGETSGNMPFVTRQMSGYYERVVRVNQKIKGATTYPKVLLGLTVIIIFIMFTFVLPRFLKSGMFSNVELPLPTRLMFSLTGFFTDNIILVLTVTAVFILMLGIFTRSSFSRVYYDRYKLTVPVLGKLVKVMCTSRFAATLSCLHSSGILLTQAVPIAARATNNLYIINQMNAAVKRMYQGEMLSNILSAMDGFSPRLVHVTLIGEETGKLGEVMTNMSAVFEEEADAAVSRMLTVLTPALLLVMAIVVGGVVLSIMLPVLYSYNNIPSYGY